MLEQLVTIVASQPAIVVAAWLVARELRAWRRPIQDLAASTAALSAAVARLAGRRAPAAAARARGDSVHEY